MNVSSNTWHARWFRFIQKKIGSEYRYASGTNLCHYLRVVLVWGPLFFGFWTFVACVFAFFVVMFLFVLPFDKGGWLGVLIAWSCYIAIAGLFFLARFIVTRNEQKLGRGLSRSRDGILTLVNALAAAKNKFCPIVSFQISDAQQVKKRA
jgi:hypothetical protein